MGRASTGQNQYGTTTPDVPSIELILKEKIRAVDENLSKAKFMESIGVTMDGVPEVDDEGEPLSEESRAGVLAAWQTAVDNRVRKYRDAAAERAEATEDKQLALVAEKLATPFQRGAIAQSPEQLDDFLTSLLS